MNATIDRPEPREGPLDSGEQGVVCDDQVTRGHRHSSWSVTDMSGTAEVFNVVARTVVPPTSPIPTVVDLSVNVPHFSAVLVAASATVRFSAAPIGVDALLVFLA